MTNDRASLAQITTIFCAQVLPLLKELTKLIYWDTHTPTLTYKPTQRNKWSLLTGYKTTIMHLYIYIYIYIYIYTHTHTHMYISHAPVYRHNYVIHLLSIAIDKRVLSTVNHV